MIYWCRAIWELPSSNFNLPKCQARGLDMCSTECSAISLAYWRRSFESGSVTSLNFFAPRILVSLSISINSSTNHYPLFIFTAEDVQLTLRRRVNNICGLQYAHQVTRLAPWMAWINLILKRNRYLHVSQSVTMVLGHCWLIWMSTDRKEWCQMECRRSIGYAQGTTGLVGGGRAWRSLISTNETGPPCVSQQHELFFE